MEKKKYRIMALVTALAGYAGGILSAFFASEESRKQMEEMVSLLFSGTSDGDFLSAFCSGPLFVLAEVCAGLFLFGFVLIFPILFFKTYGLGYSAGMCYAVLGSKGILTVLFGIFPSGVLVAVLMVTAAEDAFPFSLSFLKKKRTAGYLLVDGIKVGGLLEPTEAPVTEEKASFALERYLTRGLLLVLLSCASILADLYISPFLLNLTAGWM